MFRFSLFAAWLAAAALTALSLRAADSASALWSGWLAPDAAANDIAAIARQPDDAFHPASHAQRDLVGPRQVWMRIRLRGTSAPAALGLLEVGTRYEDLVELYVPAADGRWQVLRSGEAVGPHGRAWPGLSPAFAVRSPAPGEELVLHAHLSEHGGTTPVAVFHPDAAAFTAREQAEINENLLYFGLLAALFAYNAFLYVRLRYRDLLYYLIYLACFATAMLGGTYTATLFFPFPSPWRESVLLAAFNSALVALLLFVREFHGLSTLAPRLARVIGIVASVFALGLLAPLFDYRTPSVHAVFTLNFLLLVLGVIFVPIVSVLAWRRGARQARFFLLAFALYLVGHLAVLLEAFDLHLPPGWAERGMRIGSAAEMILLSLAISDRFRRIRAEKEALQANYTAQLERDVATRTRELQETAARLAASNADKDQLVAIIAHDVRTPLVSLLAVARSLHAAAPAEAPALAHGIAQRTGTLLALINNLLDWARLHTGQSPHEPAPFAVAGIANSVVQSLAPLATEKNLRLEHTVPDELFAHADLHAVQCVLRNLIGNALKFTPPGGRVWLDAALVRPASADEASFVELRVHDTGPGLPADLRATLATAAVVPSTPGTGGERGAGIGLALCRELVARDGGSLTFACPSEGGTVATVRLPAATLFA